MTHWGDVGCQVGSPRTWFVVRIAFNRGIYQETASWGHLL